MLKDIDNWKSAPLWNSISNGNKEWGIPAYEGTIFSKDKKISKSGFELSKISLSNSQFEIILSSLLLNKSS